MDMNGFSRRDLLKSSVAVPAAAAIGLSEAAAQTQSGPARTSASPAQSRERLLLDFGWRFHFGHANDSAKDFGFGNGRSGGFQKTGGFLSPSNLAYDDSDWQAVDLPHDWAVGLPFKNDPALASKGSYPLGREYPDTSVGWYRRVFDLPANDAGKRISVEFDGSYRDTMVVFNGFYIGRHGGGYDPFSFDLTDFASPGAPNVLLVRVDATLSDGWFYEGAGVYRHVWLVKTAPVHVKKWGTLATAKVQPGAATVTIRTEVENHAKGAQNARVVSTILDPSGREAGKAASQPAAISEWGERAYEQQVAVKQPALWSLEERNLYKLVTEVECGGTVTDRYETRFGIRDLKFDAEQGFFLNGKPVKVKGTCNHQDHAGVGVALPDAVQHFRIRKLQEMGCNAIRTSHNPPTSELLDACDALGMLVLDETRMLSSNPEGLAQFENMIRRDRNHPSVFIWSMGNEESISATDTGLRLLTSMKRAGLKHDGSRPISIAPPPAGDYMGKGGLAVCDVMGYNYADPQAEAYHKANPAVPILGTENVSAVGTRGAYVTDRAKGTVSSYDPYTTTGRASAEGWWRFVSARPYFRRFRVDWFRLSRRTVAVPVAERQFAVRHHRHLRLSEGHVLLLPIMVDRQAGAARLPTLELVRRRRPGHRGLGSLQYGPGGVVPQRPEPGREGHSERPASRLDREVRAGYDRGARLQKRQTGDDREARDHGCGGEVGFAAGPARDLGRWRGRRHLHGGGPGCAGTGLADDGQPGDFQRDGPGGSDRNR
jgi:beta-galactosidase